jgi:LPS-assembly protein
MVLTLLSSLALATGAYAQRSLTLRSDGGSVNLQANRIEQIGTNGLLIAEGNVEVVQGPSRLEADRLEVNLETGEGVALGRAIFFDGQDRLTGARIDYNFKTRTGVVHNGSAFASPYYHLSGERLERLSESVYRVTRGVFTTCEQEVPHWSFRLGEANADLESFVWGQNASFWVSKIPLIPWIPFFAAPIKRDRQTGFLIPTVGSSSSKGMFADIPFFWAIDDSQDLTLVLKPMEKLGVGFGADYRYILSERTRGRLGGFFVRQTELDNEDRYSLAWRHDQTLTDRLTLKIDTGGVSDDRYFRDFADRLGDLGRQRVESNVFLTQRWETWNLVGNLFWYQDLTVDKPIELLRLPEVKLSGVRQPVPGLPGLLFQFDGSYVNFVRELGASGQRLDLLPRLSLPLRPGGYFTVTPFLAGRTTVYDTTTHGLTSERGVSFEETDKTIRGRNLLETGADIEARATRVFTPGGRFIDALLHAVEPRVNYTFIPDVKQGDLPQWDSVDSVPHTSRLNYSLTNRVMAKTPPDPGALEGVRWELMRLTLSQSYDLLPDVERRWGNVSADLILQAKDGLRFRADAAYNVHGQGFVGANSDLSVIVAPVTLTAGTRFGRSDGTTNLHFVSGEATWRLHRLVGLRGSVEYDVKAGEAVEKRFGIDFFQQCWGVSLDVIERHQSEDIIKVSVDLLGIGSFGKK